ncbi:class A beta-lactamase-related serine hydrolase [Sphingomonas koreensis]|uniref:serine hydrolase domain-containing protein n=1 Tax=Sphingomonas koreensis TaxID=93064 RepID=UPI000A067847|nr:serine hydrolase domain-containing protein [Sphingomonas koreensis]PJI89391.1 CubicO group peptidase (beta-lactamase class C family) [Sphingomonas koreensis]RSU59193.1 class A beta-lactamase-related serine hydrolase [Sphingomonas koreensis]RSU68231.1 class A beta-lactamase-related serine hydrolase [Sphingomonas koreensis]
MRIGVLAILLAGLAASPATAQHTRDDAIAALARANPRTAIGAALIRDGKVVWTGVAGAQTDKQPATRDTLFNVASMTKPVTAELVMRLVQAKRIGLDEPMARVWMDPDVAGDPRANRLTPRMALSHQTGFPNWRPQNQRLTFVREPGTGFVYSGEGIELVARFAARKLRADFEDLADSQVFRPMGLTRIAYTWRPWMEGRVAVPANGNGYPGTAGPHPYGHWLGADDIYTTVGDYAAFVAGVARGDGLSAALKAERLRPQVAMPGCAKPVAGCPDSVAMGLGWQVLTFGKRRLALHEGGDPGVSAIAYFDVDSRDGALIFLSGEGDAPLAMQVIEAVDPQSLVLSGYRAMMKSRETAE